jgi:hypothetical protein
MGGNPRPTGEAFLLPQARGSALGISFSELRARRPDVINDTYSIWEQVGDHASNGYWFVTGGAPVRASRTAVPGSWVAAIVMDTTFSGADTALYDATVRRIGEHWSQLVGPTTPRTPLVREAEVPGVPGQVDEWLTDSVSLYLFYQVAPRNEARAIRLRAVVQLASLPASATGRVPSPHEP